MREERIGGLLKEKKKKEVKGPFRKKETIRSMGREGKRNEILSNVEGKRVRGTPTPEKKSKKRSPRKNLSPLKEGKLFSANGGKKELPKKGKWHRKGEKKKRVTKERKGCVPAQKWFLQEGKRRTFEKGHLSPKIKGEEKRREGPSCKKKGCPKKKGKGAKKNGTGNCQKEGRGLKKFSDREDRKVSGVKGRRRDPE